MSVSKFVTIILLGAAPVLAGSAPVVKNNPIDTVAVADFPSAGTFDLAKGYVYFYSPNGEEVHVHLDMTGLPKEGSPFVYHIHDNAISNENCESAGLHFNPYGADPYCDSDEDPSWCQVGDLSGKHGFINSTCFETTYVDPYLSLDDDSVANIVGKSVVFHYANLTKFACATIQLVDDEQMDTFDDLDLIPIEENEDPLIEAAEDPLIEEDEDLLIEEDQDPVMEKDEDSAIEVNEDFEYECTVYESTVYESSEQAGPFESTEYAAIESTSTEWIEIYSTVVDPTTESADSTATEVSDDSIDHDDVSSDHDDDPSDHNDDSSDHDDDSIEHVDRSILKGKKLSYVSCSSEAQAASIRGAAAMMIGAAIGALL